MTDGITVYIININTVDLLLLIWFMNHTFRVQVVVNIGE